MDRSFWLKQTVDMSLFPDLLWSRPENKAYAGKLLIVGGNAYGFTAPANAYHAAEKAGIGVARVLLPDALKRTVGRVFEAGDFAPTTPSGSFSQKALDDVLTHAEWADGVLIAGDVGRNAETAILLEKFITHYCGQLVITKDALDYFTSTPQPLITRPDTVIVASFAQLQKLGTQARFPTAFTFGMGLVRLVEALHAFTGQYTTGIVVKYNEQVLVAKDGDVSSTTLKQDLEVWRVKTAAYASVWWLQNPGKAFDALTMAVHEAIQ